MHYRSNVCPNKQAALRGCFKMLNAKAQSKAHALHMCAETPYEVTAVEEAIQTTRKRWKQTCAQNTRQIHATV